MKFNPRFLLIGLLMLACLAGCAPAAPTAAPTPVPPTAAPPTALPPTAAVPTAAPTNAAPTAAEPVVLTLVGLDGIEKTFTLAELKQLPITEGQAGMKSSTGKITLPAQYSGVSILDLVAQVGVLEGDLGVNVVAKDGYAMTFSADQLRQGNFITYDPATGDEKKLDDTLKVIVAYAVDAKPLPEDSDGVLRLALISPKNNQVTDGHWSVKWVNRIELKPLGQEWNLQLTGIITDTVDRNTFQSCAASTCHQSTWTDDKAQPWTGTPLWLLAGRMDDAVKHDGPAFNQALADLGYAVQIIAADGYSVTLPISQVARNNDILVASQVNENPLPEKYFPLRLVGNTLEKNQMTGQIVEIRLLADPKAVAQAAVPAATPTAAPTQVPAAPAAVQGDLVIVGQVGQPLGLNEADLRDMNVRQVDVEHPKKGQQTYEGVALSALLRLAKVDANAQKIVFTAADGYAVEAELAKVLACADCLLAFGETPGSLILVMPGFESSLWVKDIVKIEVQ